MNTPDRTRHAFGAVLLGVLLAGIFAPAHAGPVKILALDGAPGDRFGEEIDIDGNVLVVGAIYHDGSWNGSGAAYVFRRDGTEWVQEAEFAPSDGYPGRRFGTAVAVEGDLVIVGFPNYPPAGAAFVYAHDGTTWNQEATLLASDGVSGDQFGRSVAVSGDRLLVGAHHWGNPTPGAAYVFRRSVSGWVEEARLRGSDAGSYDYFGSYLALDGDVAVVGANDYGSRSGAAYVFRRIGTAWSQEAKLIPADNSAGDRFGADISLSGDALVVGAHGDDDLAPDSGSAYVYRHDGQSWIEETKLLPSHGGSGYEFGFGVAIRGDIAVIGAPGDREYGWRTGCAYVFGRSGTVWTELRRLVAPDATSGDYSGFDTTVGTNLAAFGNRNNENGTDAGAVYVYPFDWVTNHPPVADAGPDLELECNSPDGTWATLDGSLSTDVDSTTGTNDDITDFDWFEHYGTAQQYLLGHGETVDAGFALGSAVATLQVTDAGGMTDADDCVIQVLDTIPPTGEITFPMDGLCRREPVTVIDDFADVCDADLNRAYVPGPGATYGSHGDYEVTVTARDDSSNTASDDVAFVIDMEPPVVRIETLPPGWLVPSEMPATILFFAADEDGAAGGVVHEVVWLDGCTAYDGWTFGDGDGLLRDERIEWTVAELCRISARCGFTTLKAPEIRVEATDCAGNVGFDAKFWPGRAILRPGLCGS